MSFVLPTWVNFAALGAVAAFAVAKGDKEERRAAVYYLANNITYGVVQASSNQFSALRDLVFVSADVAFFGWLLVRSNKYWTLAASAVAMVELLTATANLASAVDWWAAMTAQLVWFYLMLTSVTVGTLQVMRGRRTERSDRIVPVES